VSLEGVISSGLEFLTLRLRILIAAIVSNWGDSVTEWLSVDTKKGWSSGRRFGNTT